MRSSWKCCKIGTSMRLMSEMARLRESWVTQELARISLAAREAGLLAQLASVNKVVLLHQVFSIIVTFVILKLFN